MIKRFFFFSSALFFFSLPRSLCIQNKTKFTSLPRMIRTPDELIFTRERNLLFYIRYTPRRKLYTQREKENNVCIFLSFPKVWLCSIIIRSPCIPQYSIIYIPCLCILNAENARKPPVLRIREKRVYSQKNISCSPAKDNTRTLETIPETPRRNRDKLPR